MLLITTPLGLIKFSDLQGTIVALESASDRGEKSYFKIICMYFCVIIIVIGHIIQLSCLRVLLSKQFIIASSRGA